MQLLFSCKQDTKVEKLSYTYKLSPVNSYATYVTRTWESRKLWCKLSFLNSHQLSCHSCFRLTRTWKLRKLSYKLLLVNSQLSLNSCSRVLGRVQEKTHTNSRFVGSHQPFLVTRGCFYLTQLTLKLITLVQCIKYFLVTQWSIFPL